MVQALARQISFHCGNGESTQGKHYRNCSSRNWAPHLSQSQKRNRQSPGSQTPTGFVILVAATCASEIEKRDAEPSYVTSNYGSAYHAYIHRYHNGKRSAEPKPEPSYPVYSFGQRHGYGRHFYKRSVEPEPELSYPFYYAPYHGYDRHIYKRCAEPEPEPLYPVYYASHHGYGRYFYNRSADPEPSYSVFSNYGYRPLNTYSNHLY
ncbi:uncharacterized protein [Procambarus clarkii]|uniref:uncharacterized protein n=1 Tax=Procambarus clarkii TaxID=6728 RepID=UPI0037441C1F